MEKEFSEQKEEKESQSIGECRKSVEGEKNG